MVLCSLFAISNDHDERRQLQQVASCFLTAEITSLSVVASSSNKAISRFICRKPSRNLWIANGAWKNKLGTRPENFYLIWQVVQPHLHFPFSSSLHKSLIMAFAGLLRGGLHGPVADGGCYDDADCFLAPPPLRPYYGRGRRRCRRSILVVRLANNRKFP